MSNVTVVNELVKEAVLKEIARRKKLANRPLFDFEANTHEKQRAMIFDPSVRVATCAGRRAGKTAAILYKMKLMADLKPGHVQVYVAKTLKYAKELIWTDMKIFFRDRIKDCIQDGINESLNQITLINGSIIKIGGCNDEEAVSKFKGGSKLWVYIDEAQDIKRSILEPLLYESVIPSLIDLNGGVWLTGNPNEGCAGVLYDCVHHLGNFKTWSVHKFWLADNPFLLKKAGKTADQIIQDICTELGKDQFDPIIQRQYYSNWIKSTESMVYKYDPKFNEWDGQLDPDYEWEYILGVDTGANDPDALAVYAFSRELAEVYLVYEFKRAQQNITVLMDQIKVLNDKYQFIKMVIDPAAGGKKMALELKDRHAIHIDIAEKKDKWTYISLMNDDFKQGLIRANRTLTPFTIDEWETLLKEQDGENKPKEVAKFDNHLCDAALYAWREAKHFTHVKREKKIEFGSPEWHQAQIDKAEQELNDRVEKRNNKSWFE